MSPEAYRINAKFFNTSWFAFDTIIRLNKLIIRVFVIHRNNIQVKYLLCDKRSVKFICATGTNICHLCHCQWQEAECYHTMNKINIDRITLNRKSLSQLWNLANNFLKKTIISTTNVLRIKQFSNNDHCFAFLTAYENLRLKKFKEVHLKELYYVLCV